ncbi:glycosyltransferase [Marinobacter alexandrii]|uniref:glycosyltransferase n=1 Tax=Marinobacter alexandrii TaxID=2570351 RepID=UPI0032980972
MKTQTLMIIEPGLRLWGSERALAATLKALREAWGRVVLVTPLGAELAGEVRNNPQRYGEITIRHAPIGLLHQKGRIARLKGVAALGLLMLRLSPARVYLNQAGLVRLIAPVCRFLSIPLTIHLRILEDIPRATQQRGTRDAGVDLIFISDAMVAAAGQSSAPPGARWHQAYDPYPPGPPPDPAPPEAPFVFVGRLSHGKGPHLLVDALADPALSDVRADIYGSGVDGDTYAAALNAQAEAAQADVRMMGFRQDVMKRLPAYRFLVSTSKYEPLGRVVMESWDSGLVPIVYANSGGAAELVRKSGAGLTFSDWTGGALAVAMKGAQGMTEETHQQMVDAGRDWMARNLGLEPYKKALSGVLF